MNPSSCMAPSRSPTVFPVQWMCAFAFTPDSDLTATRNDSQHLLPAGSDDNALPTQFHPRAREEIVSRAKIPVKRKQRRRDREASSFPEGMDRFSVTRRASTQQRTSRTRSQARCSSTMKETGHDRDPILPNSHLICPWAGRVVLDAVEIVSRKRSRDQLADPGTVHDKCPTENTHRSESLFYPSPPVSHVSEGTGSSHPITKPEKSAGPGPTLPLKTSRYFVSPSTNSTRSGPGFIPAITAPSSPSLSIPVHVESSDFEHPPLDVSFDEPGKYSVNETRYVPSWRNNLGLFDDLMIMLRRLKPILIQDFLCGRGQAESVQDDPWKVLVAVRLLNVTTGKAAIPVFCKIMSHWPTPRDLVHAPQDELVELLRPLGLYNKRATWLRDMSEYFLEDQQGQSFSKTSLAPFLSEECAIPGVGPYALDSLRIFCAGDKDMWKCVMPRDKELVRYLRWRWAIDEGKIWYPEGMSVVGDVNVPYLITLVDALAAHYESAIGGEGYTIPLNNWKVLGILGCGDPVVT